MRLVLLALLTVTAAPSPAAAINDRPFIPPSGAVDYVVTMRQQYTGSIVRSDASVLVVTHRQGWTRADKTSATGSSSTYRPPDLAWTLTRYANAKGELVNLELGRGDRATPVDQSGSRMTSATDQLLGERCRVWELVNDSKDIRVQSCLTDDGVQLWRKHIARNFENTVVATKVERRSVPASQMRPDAPLRVEDWIAADTARTNRRAPADAEVLLETTGRRPSASDHRTHVFRRRGGWIYEEDVLTAQRERRITVMRPDAGVTARAVIKNGRVESLNLNRQAPFQPASEPARGEGARPERVLDRRCVWRDLTPHVTDGGRSACRTADGLPLKRTDVVWTSQWDFTATRVTVAPLPPGAVLLPREVTDAAAWGLPR